MDAILSKIFDIVLWFCSFRTISYDGDTFKYRGPNKYYRIFAILIYLTYSLWHFYCMSSSFRKFRHLLTFNDLLTFIQIFTDVICGAIVIIYQLKYSKRDDAVLNNFSVIDENIPTKKEKCKFLLKILHKTFFIYLIITTMEFVQEAMIFNVRIYKIFVQLSTIITFISSLEMFHICGLVYIRLQILNLSLEKMNMDSCMDFKRNGFHILLVKRSNVPMKSVEDLSTCISVYEVLVKNMKEISEKFSISVCYSLHKYV